jgi:hypothetical protein
VRARVKRQHALHPKTARARERRVRWWSRILAESFASVRGEILYSFTRAAPLFDALSKKPRLLEK